MDERPRSCEASRVKLLHAADIHLDSPMRGLERYEGAPVARMRGATRRALENMVELCVGEGVDLVVIAGDLYDGGWKDYATGLFFSAQVARLREAKIPVVLVRGNHDAQSQITKSLRLPDNVRELSAKKPETFVLDDLGVAVHGQSFATRAVTEEIAAKYPPRVEGLFNVGLLHTCLDGREGHERYAPSSAAMLASKGYDYWALGHVHQREVVSKEPWIVFPGNVQGRHARETGPKGATLVTVEGGRVVGVEHRALDVVRWARCEVDASSARTADEVVDQVQAALTKEADAADGRPVAARVSVRGSTSAHLAMQADPQKITSEIRAAATLVGGEGVWVEKVELLTRAPIDMAALRERDDAIGQIARAIAELRASDEAVTPLLSELAELKKKVPHELFEGEKNALSDADALRAVMEDVEQLLIPRLLDGRTT